MANDGGSTVIGEAITVTGNVSGDEDLTIRGRLGPRLAAAFDGLTPVGCPRATQLVGEIASIQQAVQDEQADIFDPVGRGIIRWEQWIEIGSILAGKKTGRSRPDQVTLFKSLLQDGIRRRIVGHFRACRLSDQCFRFGRHKFLPALSRQTPSKRVQFGIRGLGPFEEHPVVFGECFLAFCGQAILFGQCGIALCRLPIHFGQLRHIMDHSAEGLSAVPAPSLGVV